MCTLLTILHTLLPAKINLSHKKFLVAVLQSMLVAWSVNIIKLACEIKSKASLPSIVRRIERFLLVRLFSSDHLASAIIANLRQPGPYVLTMDGTSWRLGKRRYYVLAVGICFDGISLPIAFRSLPGHTSTRFTEEIELMEHVLSVLGLSKIKCVVADREFGNANLIRWFKTMHINFCFRLRSNICVTGIDRKHSRTLGSMFASLRPGEVSVMRRAYLIRSGIMVRIYCKRIRQRNMEDSLLILASPKGFDCTSRLYRQRWTIETAFRGWKTAGFNIEDSHLDNVRFENMLAFMSVAYAVAFIDGLVKSMATPIAIMKKNGRKRESILRYGITDCLHRFWANVNFNIDDGS